ncbi:MAG: ABC transporter ATP-binding protein/permease [Candidatus Tectomicrobia bacterium]|nr:ABC transporter ATP-binding protein/permease [Candidatus Tectomicrobia bacterium]
MNHTSPSAATPQRGGITLSQLWAVLKPWRGLLALVGASVLVGAVLELVPPLLVRKVVDEQLALGRSEGLLLTAALYLGATAAVQVMGFMTEYLTGTVAQGALRGLRVRLFAHLQTLPLSYYDRTPLGDTISRCTADVETASTLFTAAAGGAVASSGGGAGGTSGATVLMGMARLATIGAAMVALSPLLSLVAALPVVPVVVVTRYFQVRVRDAERASRRAVGLQNTHLQETLGGVEVIRSLGGEAAFIARFRAALRDGLEAYNRATVYSALYVPMMVILSSLAMALVLWVGVAGREMLASLDISLGTLTAFVLLFQRFFVPIMTLGNEWQTVQAALSGLERVSQVLALPSEEPAPRGPHQPQYGGNAAIEMREVFFGYLPNRPVLRGVSLAAQPGEHIVLVGRTGAGKSSVLHLLGGLYTPWSGTVRVSGADPRLLTDGQRRRSMGVVLQVVQLFRGTVLENLTLGDASVSREAVQRAAVIAGADAFIRALPEGYDTLLGEGVQLSAGQRQLLALTRALVWDPAVLLLDEATAAVDSASESAFRAALRAAVMGCGRAVLTVAHRLATAQEADRVLVMDAGQIVEEGPPEELIRRGGRFAALLELEAAGWDWQMDGRSVI